MLNLNKNKKYLLACSYGPDSMALLNMLKEEGFNFSVAHVNYNLREESIIEEKELSKFCKENDIELFIKVVDKNTITGNIESRCREIRYSFFKSLFEEHDFDALLVAHHQDDHIETYLLQKQRKNKVSYYGLPYEREIFDITVIRPLLNLSKQEILSYCHEHNVPFMIDKTNLLDIYERNKIRLKIINNLSNEERCEILQEISKNNAKIAILQDFLKKLDFNSVKEMTNLDDEKFAYALHEDLYSVMSYKDEVVSISQDFASEIKKALLSENPNIEIKITDSLSYVKSYGRCYFQIKSIIKKYSYKINSPCELDTPYFYLNFTNGAEDRNISEDDYPLTIRTANKNDTFMVKDYEVSVRRAFIDWKMPLHLRAFWPVIVNKRGIVVYIPRYRSNFVVNKNLNFYVKDI